MAQKYSQYPPVVINLIASPTGYLVQNFEVVEMPTISKAIIYHNQGHQLTEEEELLSLTKHPFSYRYGQQNSEALDQNRKMEAQPPVKDNLNVAQLKENFNSLGKISIPRTSTHSQWFELSKIHKLEIQQLPEFFTGLTYKTPDLYMKYRNFIIQLFFAKPDCYLTKIACRRILKGDANAIIRIHKFLEKHGIINFGLTPAGKEAFEHPVIVKQAVCPSSKRQPPRNLIQNSQTQAQSESTLHQNSLIYNITSRTLSKAYRSFCISCGITCGMVWFQRKQTTTSETCICQKCYLAMDESGRSEYEKTDIVKRITSDNSQRSKQNWSLEENYKMIDALVEKDATWNSMFQKMGKKRTKQDIIFHFLQFPIVNYNLRERIPVSPLQTTEQKEMRIIRKLYQRSQYNREHGIEEQEAPLQSSNDNLKKVVYSQIRKYSSRIDTVSQEDNQAISTELKYNFSSLITKLRLLRKEPQAPAAEQPEPQVLNIPMVQEGQGEVFMDEPATFLNQNQSSLNFFEEMDDVDKYLQ